MDFFLAITYATTVIIFLYFIYMLLEGIFSNKKGNVNNRTPPKVAGAWPVIGHLHLFSGSNQPHKTFGLMADKYGPIFTVKFGVHQVLVVNDSKIAQDCLTTNDKALASRPKSLAVELLAYNYAVFGLGPYGPYWRELKKIVVLELLSNHRVQMFRHIREFQVKTTIKTTYEKWSKEKMNDSSNFVKIEMKEWFENLTMTIIVRMLFGKELEVQDGKRARKAMTNFFKLLGAFVVADYIPSLRCLDIGGYEKEMKENAKEIDYILEKWLVEHKKKTSCGEKKCEDEKDFMDIMLSLFEDAMDEDLAAFDADTIIKSTCLSMLAGGSDTIVVSLTWTLSLLLNNPQVMEKAQEELDIQVGRNTLVDESHINNLVFLQAITKESLRLYPPGPLLAPHESLEDCTIGGYNIPKGTRVLFNLWKIQRDSIIWSEPDLFKPERFLTTHKDLDVKGNHFELIPFGAGRRICPGISSTLVLLHLTLANLLHSFKITRPSDEPIDMTASFATKATPLEVLVAPRLSLDLYY
ncbi:cytochrome P450 82A3-like [Solanum dulcamara]|uniref:cytochrome P450 82A3-like n=1 Tax=Solanum dulcamara TaxID=45834 RepID=UPI00248524D4|nr:cytochrome P450 82A3-like [Solanum dulcamara]XP_055836041.1 cytochrome P450 82A3-like [Solanum dulcamara]